MLCLTIVLFYCSSGHRIKFKSKLSIQMKNQTSDVTLSDNNNLEMVHKLDNAESDRIPSKLNPDELNSSRPEELKLSKLGELNVSETGEVNSDGITGDIELDGMSDEQLEVEMEARDCRDDTDITENGISTSS